MSSKALASQMADLQAAYKGASSSGGLASSAIQASPEYKIVSYVWNAIEGILSVKTGIDWPNGDQVLVFCEEMASNWGTLAASYVYDWQRSDAWARTNTVTTLFMMAKGWPCSSRIALAAKASTALFPGKKAGSNTVHYWGDRLGLLMNGKPCTYYENYVKGKGTGQLMTCQPGAIASSAPVGAVTALGKAVESFSLAVWEDPKASKAAGAAPVLKGQIPDLLTLQSVAKGVLDGGKINVLAGAVLIANDLVGAVVKLIDTQGKQIQADPTIRPATSTWEVTLPPAESLAPALPGWQTDDRLALAALVAAIVVGMG